MNKCGNCPLHNCNRCIHAGLIWTYDEYGEIDELVAYTCELHDDDDHDDIVGYDGYCDDFICYLSEDVGC